MKNLFLSLVIAGATQLAFAQEYPGKPIRVIVPFSAGSAMDILGRILTPKLHEAMGQPVIADNRAGGAGRIGHQFVAKAAPDGYTLLLTALGPLIHNGSPRGTRTVFAAECRSQDEFARGVRPVDPRRVCALDQGHPHRRN